MCVCARACALARMIWLTLCTNVHLMLQLPTAQLRAGTVFLRVSLDHPSVRLSCLAPFHPLTLLVNPTSLSYRPHPSNPMLPRQLLSLSAEVRPSLTLSLLSSRFFSAGKNLRRPSLCQSTRAMMMTMAHRSNLACVAPLFNPPLSPQSSPTNACD
jgi:hypothetical protein